MSIYSTANLFTDVFSHTEALEQIDADTRLPSQEDLVLENAHTHQENGSQIEISSLNQGIPGFLEDSITFHSKVSKSYNHKEGEENISQKDPKVSQVEERAILNEVYFSNPLG